MKKARRVVALLFAVLMITAVMSVSVSATANTTDRLLTNIELSFYYYSDLVEPQYKFNETPVYLYITDSGYAKANGVCVQAFGYNSSSNCANLTVRLGALVDPSGGVFCYEDVQQSIRNLIYEKNYFQASLRFKSGNTTGDTIFRALWSPDSTRTYTVAS